MDATTLPSLYSSADTLSQNAQKFFYRALRWHLALLAVAALLSVLNLPHRSAALTQALVLASALGLAIYLMTKRPERLWYGSRAVAESVKTLAWRFAARAEPFNLDDKDAVTLFISKLSAILSQNHEVACRLVSENIPCHVTSRMNEIRAMSLADRISVYRRERVNDQLEWYSRKAAKAGNNARVFSCVVVGLNIVAVLLAALRIAFPSSPFWPTDFFVTLSACVMTWLQAKRFSELAASYTLAAHEISLISAASSDPETDTDFSRFVADSENAFSREHTQWIARKDH